MPTHTKQWSSATPGLLIILIDQSGSMLSDYNGDDSKTVCAARAVNRVIDTIIQKNFDGESPKNRCFITVIGYNHEVKKLNAGYLKDLDDNPIRIDTIKKKESDGAGGIITVDYPMPIWVEPITQDGATNMKGAFEMAKAIIEKWIVDKPESPAPVIINISDGVPYYDQKEVKDCMKETIAVAKDIMKLSVEDGNVLIFNAMINAFGQTLEYPSSISECTKDASRFLFEISSLIPDSYKAFARPLELNIKENSKGCIFDAKEVDMINLINFGSGMTQRDVHI